MKSFTAGIYLPWQTAAGSATLVLSGPGIALLVYIETSSTDVSLINPNKLTFASVYFFLELLHA